MELRPTVIEGVIGLGRFLSGTCSHVRIVVHRRGIERGLGRVEADHCVRVGRMSESLVGVFE